jgi:hypothetical protein
MGRSLDEFSSWLLCASKQTGGSAVVLAGKKRPRMIGLFIGKSEWGSIFHDGMVVLNLRGPFGGITTFAELTPNQAEELALRLSEMAARARLLSNERSG